MKLFSIVCLLAHASLINSAPIIEQYEDNRGRNVDNRPIRHASKHGTTIQHSHALHQRILPDSTIDILTAATATPTLNLVTGNTGSVAIPSASQLLPNGTGFNVTSITGTAGFIAIPTASQLLTNGTRSNLTSVTRTAGFIAIPTASQLVPTGSGSNQTSVSRTSGFIIIPTASQLLPNGSGSNQTSVSRTAGFIAVPTTSGLLPNDTESNLTSVAGTAEFISTPTASQLLPNGTGSNLTSIIRISGPVAIPTASQLLPNGTRSNLTSTTILIPVSSSSVTTLSTSTTSSARYSPTAALRGVNIGHWLIIEPWMDDGKLIKGKFKNVQDQWTFDQLDTDGRAIKAHWNTWFTEADVKRLAGYGFNALRIPIGYWAFDAKDTPYHAGAADYVDKAVVWARRAGMKVMVDLHGSPGSQNGNMHSGHIAPVQWQNANNLELTTQVLRQMVRRWGNIENSDTVFAIQIVNEPTPDRPNNFTLSQLWASATYQDLQQVIQENNLNKNIQIITHDSFMGIRKFISLATRLISPINRATFGVDQHDYQLYTTQDNALDQPGHIRKACSWAKDLATTKAVMPVYVGEWSALSNICVAENGKTTPASRSSSSVSCSTAGTKDWSPQLIEQVRRYVEAQLDVFEANSDGHFIWSFKAGGGWGVYNLINIGAFPQPFGNRRYPKQCH